MTPKQKTPFAKTKKDIQLVKDLLYPLLRNEILIVEFRKIDGKMRKMECTRNSAYFEKHLPDYTDIDPTTMTVAVPSHKNPDVCKVWDMKKEAWRSFRFDSVISVAVV